MASETITKSESVITAPSEAAVMAGSILGGCMEETHKNTVAWLPIKRTNGVYEVSNHGGIRRAHDGYYSPINPSVSRDGYYSYETCLRGKRTSSRPHIDVAKAFIPNPFNKPQVNHKDGNKINNNVENLEWVTAQENSIHAVKTGLNKSVGEGHPMCKLSKDRVLAIRRIWAWGLASQTQLAAAFKVGRSTIGDIVRRKKWKSI